MPLHDIPHHNLARFDFMFIRLAVACARTGNLMEATRECNLVLPAASRRIRDLEKALAATVRASLAWRCADGAGAPS